MLLGLGILATAVATTLQKAQALEAIVLSLAAVAICVAFYKMDCRNRALYQLGQDVLSRIESSHLFQDHEKGIAKEIDKEDEEIKRSPWRVRGWWDAGQHRYWMPIVTLIFAILFMAAFFRACDMRDHPDRYPSAEKTIVVFQPPGSSGANRPDFSTNESNQTGMVIPADGTGSISGWHWLSIGVGLLAVVFGASIFLNGRKLLGSGLVTIGMATAALPNFSIPIRAQFHLGPHFEGKIETDIKTEVDHLLELFRKSQPGLMESVRFGGFGEGIEAFD